MVFSKVIKILAVGSSLITTSSLWFFNPSINDSPQILTRSSGKGTSSSAEVRDHDNLNLFTPVGKLPNRNGKTIIDSNFKKKSNNNSELTFTLGEESQERTLRYSSWIDIKVGVKTVLGYKSEYSSFDKSNINISLFKKAVWYSDTNEDEYEPIESQKINELFEGLDETKTKQLLLSLGQMKKWIKLSGTTPIYYTQPIYYQHPHNLNDLKNLKIKYFTDFEGLKNYIKEKVTSCTKLREACVAHKDELDVMETDKLDFFQSTN